MEVRAAIRKGDALKLSDGGGLTLRVLAPGRGQWVLRFMLSGKSREMGLGAAPAVSLSDARAAAEEARRQLSRGVDPISARHAGEAARRKAEAAAAEAASQASERTFQALAQAHIEAHAPGWKNPRQRSQWLQSLEKHAFPKLGAKDVGQITRADVLEVLSPIWATIPATASKIRLRIEAILESAEARGLRDGRNPAAWKGGVKGALPARSRIARTRHQPALPWQQVPSFMEALQCQPGTAALALRLVIATGLRTSEVLGARWSEINSAAATWTLPAARMKGRVVRDFRVPLSAVAQGILAEAAAQRLEDAQTVFPAVGADRPLSNMAMLALLKRMQGDNPSWLDAEGRRIVPHGFRSSFRDWCSEATSVPREIAEACLGHVVGNAVERAYARSDLLDKRRDLMERWGKFISAPESSSQVIHLLKSKNG
ncbi:tyrosine-type recombinase/integrase [Roseomonas sp. ACRSG]|nr:tyrosine-type recombinase/integrase [Roseomonas sp. ACRSG]